MNPEHQLLVAVLGRGVLRDHRGVVTADDLGLTRGDGVFDATRVVTAPDGSSRVDQLDAHLQRFARSIAGVDGPTPDLEAWRRLIDEAVAAWRFPGEAVLKIIHTNGPEVMPGLPVGLLTIAPLSDHALEERDGIDVVCLSRGVTSTSCSGCPWLLGGVKTLAYAVNVAALREASRRGADDVIFTSTDGFLLEGPTSGLLVEAGGSLWTTPTGATGILQSITVETVLERADEEGVPTASRLMRPAELPAAQGVWLASSVRGVVPVRTVDGVPIPTDEAMTARMRSWAGFGEEMGRPSWDV
ncbi:aminodeoxychorismate lyase [Acidipropionibacterium timonense]|uniref:aminodeoxychorismate lyase n=1 Tax=Acidipropionibacterium timonense TaxID=2161818 RepID=UPI001030E87B|nr:aminodeoxychorismate lyase [Acidipropionibacterium timonense]